MASNRGVAARQDLSSRHEKKTNKSHKPNCKAVFCVRPWFPKRRVWLGARSLESAQRPGRCSKQDEAGPALRFQYHEADGVNPSRIEIKTMETTVPIVAHRGSLFFDLDDDQMFKDPDLFVPGDGGWQGGDGWSSHVPESERGGMMFHSMKCMLSWTCVGLPMSDFARLDASELDDVHPDIAYMMRRHGEARIECYMLTNALVPKLTKMLSDRTSSVSKSWRRFLPTRFQGKEPEAGNALL